MPPESAEPWIGLYWALSFSDLQTSRLIVSIVRSSILNSGYFDVKAEKKLKNNLVSGCLLHFSQRPRNSAGS